MSFPVLKDNLLDVYHSWHSVFQGKSTLRWKFFEVECSGVPDGTRSRFQVSKNIDEFLKRRATRIVNKTSFWNTKVTFCRVKTVTE